jgi:hypothetical protein
MHQLLDALRSDSLFKDWQKQHSKGFLSHFFCHIDSSLKPKSGWEIGFYDETTQKMTVFVQHTNSFIIKPADDVFKKPDEKIEKLDLDTVTVTLENAIGIFLSNKETYFEHEILGDGFVVMQSLAGKTLWNFTSITKTVKFVNLKINAINGEIIGHEVVNLIAK